MSIQRGNVNIQQYKGQIAGPGPRQLQNNESTFLVLVFLAHNLPRVIFLALSTFSVVSSDVPRFDLARTPYDER